jgi:cytoskeletal protein CcmA (bactofilin family)
MPHTNKPPYIGPHGSPAAPAKPGAPNVTVVTEHAKTPAPEATPGTTPSAAPNTALQTVPGALQVPVGSAMYSGESKQVPTLQALVPMPLAAGEHNDKSSMIAEGVNFVGNAQLIGLCSVGGKVEGNLVQSPGQSITVIVSETGHVKGDIVADNISVMGQTDGLLDAGGGSVALHDASRVSGHVRYTRLQVNGADLNATLEKAATKRERPMATKQPH